jgi:hypothetical protein
MNMPEHFQERRAGMSAKAKTASAAEQRQRYSPTGGL